MKIPTWQERMNNWVVSGDLSQEEKINTCMNIEIADLRAALAERDAEIQNQYRCIESHAKVTQKAEAALAERDAEIADKTDEAELLDQMIDGLQAELATLRTAAQQALEALNGGDLLCELKAAQLLTAALESK